MISVRGSIGRLKAGGPTYARGLLRGQSPACGESSRTPGQFPVRRAIPGPVPGNTGVPRRATWHSK